MQSKSAKYKVFWSLAGLLIIGVLVAKHLLIREEFIENKPKQTVAAEKEKSEEKVSPVQEVVIDVEPELKIVQPSKKIEKVIAFQEDASDEKGRFKRTKIIETSFQYPLILTEEVFQKDSETNKNRLVSRVEMVADHVLVKPHPDMTEDDIADMARRYDAQIRSFNRTSGLYLLSFDGRKIGDLQNKINEFKSESGFVLYAEPDFIVSVD